MILNEDSKFKDIVNHIKELLNKGNVGNVYKDFTERYLLIHTLTTTICLNKVNNSITGFIMDKTSIYTKPIILSNIDKYTDGYFEFVALLKDLNNEVII